MKKLAAILLMCLFLFNLVGYRLLISHWKQESDRSLVSKLDRGDYTKESLVEIKLAAPLTYPRDMPAFERADGEIEVGGVFYRYVKMKWYNDTLSLLVVHNTEKSNLQSRQHDYYQHTADLPGSQGKKDAAGFKIFTTDYFFQEAERETAAVTPASITYSTFTHLVAHAAYLQAIEQPPEYSI